MGPWTYVRPRFVGWPRFSVRVCGCRALGFRPSLLVRSQFNVFVFLRFRVLEPRVIRLA